MKIAFTGTQRGVPEAQLLAAAELFPPGAELHFGDCVGADAQVWFLLSSWGFRTVAHPPVDPTRRAFCEADEVREPMPYLVRNRDMVDECERLVAAPRTAREVLRSGTWSTVRYARLVGKPVAVAWPDGSATHATGNPPSRQEELFR